MARMIPQWVHDDAPASERRVFERLRDDSAAGHWTVLHSLGLARRRSGPYGEIDFVVIVPGEGVVCLEVKGGDVSCENGVWRTRNRRGEVAALKKSPFGQAKDNMFALLDAIRERFGDSAAESRCLMGYAVVFPDVACPPLPPEVDRAEIVDRHDLSKSISDSVVRCVLCTRRKTRSRGPASGTVKSLLGFLRPDFARIVTKQVRIDRLVDEQVRLTEEQFNRLDDLEANDRCLLTGAAGTGKTLLAAEYARRMAGRGARVLLVCFNALLGGWIRRQIGNTAGVTVGNWHDVARRFARGSSRKDEFEEKDKAIRESGEHDLNKVGLDETYAEYGTFGLEERGAPFDVLVVDEAQDVLWSRHVLRFLDAALRGGLAGGRWAVFGDPNRQAIRPNVEPVDLRAVLAGYGVANLTLSLNCRNSRSIAEATAVVTGVESRIRKPDGTVPELGVEHHFCGKLDLAALLTRTVERLTHEGTPVEDVVVLSPCRLDDRQKSGLAGIERIAGHPLQAAEPGADVAPGALRWSTIGRFKGLESKVVILVNVDAMDGERNESLLYVGMTRARALLVLLVSDTPRARRAWEPRFREMGERGTSGGGDPVMR